LHLPEKKSEDVNLIQDGTLGTKKPAVGRLLKVIRLIIYLEKI
jgi:hypothetical protein